MRVDHPWQPDLTVIPKIPILVTNAGYTPMQTKRRAKKRPRVCKMTTSTSRRLMNMLKRATTSGTRMTLNPQK